MKWVEYIMVRTQSQQSPVSRASYKHQSGINSITLPPSHFLQCKQTMKRFDKLATIQRIERIVTFMVGNLKFSIFPLYPEALGPLVPAYLHLRLTMSAPMPNYICPYD